MSFLPNAHPIFVHFSIGMFLSGVVLNLVGLITDRSSLRHAANWNIIGAAAVSVFTVVTGWFAAANTPHGSGEIHALMERHQLLGFGALATLLFAAGVQMWSARSDRPAWAQRCALAISAIGAGMILLAGAAGGKLVFVHGVGVAAVPVSEHHEHSSDEHPVPMTEVEHPQSEADTQSAVDREAERMGTAQDVHPSAPHEGSNGSETMLGEERYDHEHVDHGGDSHDH